MRLANAAIIAGLAVLWFEAMAIFAIIAAISLGVL